MPSNTQPQLNELQQQLNDMMAAHTGTATEAPAPVTPTPPPAPPTQKPVTKKTPPRPKPTPTPRLNKTAKANGKAAKTRTGRTFLDEELTRIDAKPPGKITKKDRKLVSETHSYGFAQDIGIVKRIQTIRQAGTVDGKFSAKTLSPEDRAELKQKEKRLADAKYFLLRRCDEALGTKRGA